jgi:hypothetical protein
LRPNEKPHSVWLWNDSADSRTLPVRLVLGGGSVVFDRRVAFPANGVFAVDLLEPASYRLEVGGDGRRGRVVVDRATFDCNSSVTDVAVRTGGAVESRVSSTTMGCGPLS